MTSKLGSKCSQLVLAGAVALTPVAMPAIAQASEGMNLNLDTHLSAATQNVVATGVVGHARVATAAVTHADHDNWWIFHNHTHTAQPAAKGAFGQGTFAV